MKKDLVATLAKVALTIPLIRRVIATSTSLVMVTIGARGKSGVSQPTPRRTSPCEKPIRSRRHALRSRPCERSCGGGVVGSHGGSKHEMPDLMDLRVERYVQLSGVPRSKRKQPSTSSMEGQNFSDEDLINRVSSQRVRRKTLRIYSSQPERSDMTCSTFSLHWQGRYRV